MELKIKQITLQTLLDFIDENDISVDVIDERTRLIGHSSFLDSMDLVSFIVMLEENINDEFSSELELTDEKAMSRRTSPFTSVKTVVDYIHENLKNE